MKAFSVIWEILIIISLIISAVFIVFGIYDQIMGPAATERLLEKLHIPLNYNQVVIIEFIWIAILIVSYILKVKFFRKS